MRLRHRLRSLALVALAAVMPAAAAAQDVSVRAYLNPGATVGSGRQFVLNVEVTGSQSVSRQPDIPDLSAFAQFLGSSQQSSIRMVNGATSITLTIQYRFQALEEGSFTIPAFDVDVGGRTFRTEPLSLTVAPTAQAPSGGGGGGGAAGGGDAVAAEDLFVTAEATKTRVVDGEPFVVEYRIWTRVDVNSFTITRLPEPQGFWVEDVTPTGQPQVEQLQRNGQNYTTAVIRRVALVPTGAGERTIDPIGVEAQVRVRSRDPFDDFFGGSSIFGSRAVPTSAASNRLTVTVSPLPPGRPQPWSGVVGSLRLTAELDRDSVGANDAVTLTIRATGEGNLRAVPEPELDLPADFEAFPPEVSESVRELGAGLAGEKTFEYVLIPRAPGSRALGPFRMGWYDPSTRAYRMAETQPLGLTVSGTGVGGGPAVLSRGGVAQLREDIRFIHLGAELSPAGRGLLGSVGFWMFALLPLAGIAGAVTLRRHRDLLEGDVAYARGRRASRVAKKRLAQARGLAGGTDSRAFYAEVARALRGLAADRMNMAEAGLRTDQLPALLASRGVDEATIRETMSCLEHCDRQRFAPPSHDAGEEARFLERAGALMSTLDRAIR
jgi:hypothetical protein